MHVDDKDREQALKLRLLDTSNLNQGDVYNFGDKLQARIGDGTHSKWCPFSYGSE